MRRLLVPLLAAGALLASTSPALGHHVTVRPLTTACPANQVGANPFVDVAASSPFELAISCLADYGIARGRTATSYAPAGSVLRQQMAQFLHRLGSRAGIGWDTSDVGFQDLGGLAPEAREAINALANAGVAQGRSTTAFDPAGVVTRGQMASFLARLADAGGVRGFTSAGDAFDDDEGVVHEPSIDRIAAAGGTAGRGSDRFFDPHSAVTREQMAAFLARSLDVLVDQGVADSRYREDVAPVTVTLDQAGQLVEAGGALTGSVAGDGVRGVRLASPCVGTVDVDRQFSVPTDRQAPIGRCPVTVSVVLENGRTVGEPLFVVMPGFTDRPELVHVERVSSSTAGGVATSDVRFLYDGAVSLPGDDQQASRFVLDEYEQPWRAPRPSHVATSVRQERDNTVVASFGTAEVPVGPQQLDAVSYAAAGRGAVLDRDLRPAPVGDALLNPRSSTAEAFSGPSWEADLLSVTGRRPDPDDARRFLVDFTFDAPFSDPHAVGFSFAVVLRDGTTRGCQGSPSAQPQRRFAVSCDAAGAEGPRGEVARGILSTHAGYVHPVSGTVLTRLPTTAPDVVDVRWGPGVNEATFTFDEPVTYNGDARLFQRGGPRDLEPVYALDGRQPADPHRVVVTLQGDGIDHSTRASVRGGAVTSRSTGQANAYEQVWVPARNPEVVPAGRTTGADLVRITAGPDSPPVRHDYDSPLDQRLSGDDYQRSEDVVDMRLYLRDGTELVCATWVYPFTDYSQSFPERHMNVRCTGYDVVGPDDARLGRASNEQIRAGVYGTASYNTTPRARVVEGARR